MTGNEQSSEGDGSREASYAPEVEAFARALSRDDRTFLVLRDELYAGRWEDVEADLRARLDGKPFIFQLATRIEEDLERIERLRRFESEHGVDLRAVIRALGLE
ncbi:MAG: hypothetical protein D6776_06150 [Planctomycetota bacterium]|nr:MAG: hypothetical protein D6776_06150 [Planctomycetota bacterium]